MAKQNYHWVVRSEVETGESFFDDFTGMTVAKTRIDKRELTGILTDEHAASSYGVPVFVVDGVAYGPLDVVAGTPDQAGAIVNTHRDQEADDLARKFVRAGIMAMAPMGGR